MPDYYESRIIETLKLFNKTSVFPNIRTIKLSDRDKKVIYLEEFLLEENVKKSYGVILVPKTDKLEDANTLSSYTQKLRLILDKNKNIEETMVEINSSINPFEKWTTNTELGLIRIKNLLDNRE